MSMSRVKSSQVLLSVTSVFSPLGVRLLASGHYHRIIVQAAGRYPWKHCKNNLYIYISCFYFTGVNVLS